MTLRSDDAAAGRRRGRARLVVLASLAGAAVGLAAVYGIAIVMRNAGGAAECRPATEVAQRIAPLVQGEVAAVTVADKPRRIPDVAFTDGTGQPRTLADWRGRTVLFNLWATWCVPCRKEMPALDGLQARLGGSGFEVVAVNIDTRDPMKPKAWLQEVGIGRLAYYADPSAKAFQELKLVGLSFGMPTTLIVDPQGCEIASLAGPAAWDSDDALKLIAAVLGS